MSLLEKDGIRISPYSVQMRENTDQKNILELMEIKRQTEI